MDFLWQTNDCLSLMIRHQSYLCESDPKTSAGLGLSLAEKWNKTVNVFHRNLCVWTLWCWPDICVLVSPPQRVESPSLSLRPHTRPPPGPSHTQKNQGRASRLEQLRVVLAPRSAVTRGLTTGGWSPDIRCWPRTLEQTRNKSSDTGILMVLCMMFVSMCGTWRVCHWWGCGHYWGAESETGAGSGEPGPGDRPAHNQMIGGQRIYT